MTSNAAPQKHIPKPHMLNSLVNAELPHGPLSALNEFIDNSFGPDAGDANMVRIAYINSRSPQRAAILIQDDGNGVKDINALFDIGGSESRLSDRDIGNFGWGAKVGALYLGWNVSVRTVHNGLYREHAVDWQKAERKGEWPDVCSMEPRPPKGKELQVGTVISISNRHNGRAFATKPLADRLAHIYAPALRNGREIVLAHYEAVGKNDLKLKYEIKVSERVNKRQLKDRIEDRIHVEGMGATVVAGTLENAPQYMTGIHISYGHRVVNTTGAFPGKSVPTGMVVYVELDKEWKRYLTATKNDLAFYKHELLEAVQIVIQPLLDELETRAKTARLDLISAQINAAGSDLFAALTSDPGMFGEDGHDTERTGQTGGDNDTEPGGNANEAERQKAKVGGEHDAREARKPENPPGLTFRLESMGDKMVASVSVLDSAVEVALNSDVPYVEQAFSYPLEKKGSAIWGLISHAIVLKLVSKQHVDALAKLFPSFAKHFDKSPWMGEAERQQYVLAHLLKAAPPLKEPTTGDVHEVIHE